VSSLRGAFRIAHEDRVVRKLALRDGVTGRKELYFVYHAPAFGIYDRQGVVLKIRGNQSLAVSTDSDTRSHRTDDYRGSRLRGFRTLQQAAIRSRNRRRLVRIVSQKNERCIGDEPGSIESINVDAVVISSRHIESRAIGRPGEAAIGAGYVDLLLLDHG